MGQLDVNRQRLCIAHISAIPQRWRLRAIELKLAGKGLVRFYLREGRGFFSLKTVGTYDFWLFSFLARAFQIMQAFKAEKRKVRLYSVRPVESRRKRLFYAGLQRLPNASNGLSIRALGL